MVLLLDAFSDKLSQEEKALLHNKSPWDPKAQTACLAQAAMNALARGAAPAPRARAHKSGLGFGFSGSRLGMVLRVCSLGAELWGFGV